MQDRACGTSLITPVLHLPMQIWASPWVADVVSETTHMLLMARTVPTDELTARY